MPAIRYFKISFVQVYNFFVVLNSYDIQIKDTRAGYRKHICKTQCTQLAFVFILGTNRQIVLHVVLFGRNRNEIIDSLNLKNCSIKEFVVAAFVLNIRNSCVALFSDSYFFK